jgi:hypothetical protein
MLLPGGVQGPFPRELCYLPIQAFLDDSNYSSGSFNEALEAHISNKNKSNK